jgi:hypothetical protein
VYRTFARHLVLPYISVDLDLDQQLVHLSAAAHITFYLYRDNLACTQFMPTQSYVDIMIMIKNVFFCVAKVKVNNPHGLFYPILLGTDHLETFFGLIWMAVGTDSNVDLLQLGSHASGLTEVAAILAEHPEWDTGMRHLTLPHIHRESTSNLDHITPKDWLGNASVGKVNLHSCWLLGRREAINCLPEAGHLFEQLLAEGSADINMLSPLGTLLVNLHEGGEDNLDNFSPKCSDNHSPPLHAAEQLEANNTCTSLSYTHEGDLEDAMADEMPHNSIDSKIVIQGQETSKAKALCRCMVYRSNRSSTD